MSAIEYYLQSQDHLNKCQYFEGNHHFTTPQHPSGNTDMLNFNKTINDTSLDKNDVDKDENDKFLPDETPFLKTLESAELPHNSDFNYPLYNKPLFEFPYDYKAESNATTFPPSNMPTDNTLYSFNRPDQFFNTPLYISYNQPDERPKKRSPTITKKERRRTHSINAAFSALRNCIPNVPSDTKLSKIKTLRLATSYIAFLMNVIDKNDPQLAEIGFKADMTSSRRNENREEKRRREAQEILKASMKQAEKQPKGRTGWPQQVWASELK